MRQAMKNETPVHVLDAELGCDDSD